jgi:hypothetical protein
VEKVRFLSMHVVGLADLEGQDYFFIQLMGIIHLYPQSTRMGTSGESGRIPHASINGDQCTLKMEI